MSNTNNNLELYKAVSIISIGVVVTFTILLLFVPIFSSNYFYEVGTVLVYSGKIVDIPKGWALCDGNNGTPNLLDKFVIGAWSSNRLTHVEITNDGLQSQYIGNGFDPNLIKNSDNIIKRNALGLMTGQIPFTLGTDYSHASFNNNGADTKNISILGSDHGTSWFKQYNYNISDRVKSCNGNKENFQKYYRDQIIDTNLCNGITRDNFKDQNFILNDYTMMRKNKKLTIANGNPSNPDFKYYYDVNSKVNDFYPTEYSLASKATIQTITDDDGNQITTVVETPSEDPIENNILVSHIPIKRRLFRDYEDYKILLEEGKRLGVSCYDCLPMNHKFTSHNYKFGNKVDDFVGEHILNDASKNIHLINVNNSNEIRLKEYMNNIVYEKPYTNNPSFFKLAYIIRIK